VRTRLSVFLAENTPLLEHYGRQNRLIRVDGNLGIDGVADEIISALRSQVSTG